MALPDLVAEAVANVNRLNGGPVFDLSANTNVGVTLKLVQAASNGYATLLAEGKGWGGNPESTMTAAYPKDAPKTPPKPKLPLPSDVGPTLEGAPLDLPPGGGEVKNVLPGESVPAITPGTPTPEERPLKQQ